MSVREVIQAARWGVSLRLADFLAGERQAALVEMARLVGLGFFLADPRRPELWTTSTTWKGYGGALHLPDPGAATERLVG